MTTSDDSDALRIRDLAGRLRAAIEACDLKRLSITFQEFPRGSCGDATLVLAKYLKDNGQEGFVYVCGMREGHSHAWLVAIWSWISPATTSPTTTIAFA